MPACPKPRPKLLGKREQAAKVRTTDRKERETCHTRSGGRCEVCVMFVILGKRTAFRCVHGASENHHLKGGIGRKNVGDSILATHRLDVCAICHRDITGHVLKPANEAERYDAATVTYERVR